MIPANAIQAKTLLGRAIVSQADGKIVGHVRDIVFDHDTNEALSLVTAEKDLFGLIDAVVVPWRFVRAVANDVVMVESANAAMKLHDDPRSHGVVQRETVLSGTKILSDKGEILGTLADMYIDVTNGNVVGYVVSGGFLSDTLRGKKFIPAPPGLEIGKDAAIARPTAEAQIKGKIPADAVLPEIEHNYSEPVSSTRESTTDHFSEIKRPNERRISSSD
jgi:uncharacterized protein YrrD